MTDEEQAINFGWSHGRYLDYWSVVHFLTGAILGIGAIIFFNNHLLTFVVIIILLSLYEGVEILARVAEGFENMFLDVVIGSIGAALAIFWLPEIVSRKDILGILILVILVNLVCVSQGWKNFLQRKAAKSRSYRHILYTLYFIYLSGALIIVASLFFMVRGFVL